MNIGFGTQEQFFKHDEAVRSDVTQHQMSKVSSKSKFMMMPAAEFGKTDDYVRRDADANSYQN